MLPFSWMWVGTFKPSNTTELKFNLIKSGRIHHSKWEVTDSAWKYWLPDPQQHLWSSAVWTFTSPPASEFILINMLTAIWSSWSINRSPSEPGKAGNLLWNALRSLLSCFRWFKDGSNSTVNCEMQKGKSEEKKLKREFSSLLELLRQKETWKRGKVVR